MQPETQNFRRAAAAAAKDEALQTALDGLATGFVARRADAVANCPEFEALREQGRHIRQATFQALDAHLLAFERAAKESGSTLHWAETAGDACRIIEEICTAASAKVIAKGKSMVSEEVGLNDHLHAAGFQVFETDLGEYLIQMRGETPSHIIAPAIHLNETQARDSFLAYHHNLDPQRPLNTPEDIVGEARQVLRQTFLTADVGITGANFLIAETGSAVVVTNEGNGDLCATLPKVHIIIAAIDKIVPTLAETSVLLQLLARSATGQTMTAYTSLFTGPKQPDDLDGPDACHIVIVDNGRSELLASDAREVLSCIRCGACLNHCPVYSNVGGHAYGWVYPGPIGAALNPGLLGIDQARDLPLASTLCGRCEDVCPVKIPLPKLLRQWRAADFAQQHTSLYKFAISLWVWLARHPNLYAVWAKAVARFLHRSKGAHRALPFVGGWTQHRDFPSSQGKTFQHQWRERNRRETP
ncbi:MAG: iron-sulfur cluster-binding protein [Alphaproteobacteria bacterium]|nr:iron-sulfur cluster-binding protein [Alphaproteobacteria bacterium]